MFGRNLALAGGLALIIIAFVMGCPGLFGARLSFDFGPLEAYRGALSGLLTVCGGALVITALRPRARRQPPTVVYFDDAVLSSWSGKPPSAAQVRASPPTTTPYLLAASVAFAEAAAARRNAAAGRATA